jgi:hypothetical protein
MSRRCCRALSTFGLLSFFANVFTAFHQLAVFLLIGKTSALFTMNNAGVVKDWLLIYSSYSSSMPHHHAQPVRCLHHRIPAPIC